MRRVAEVGGRGRESAVNTVTRDAERTLERIVDEARVSLSHAASSRSFSRPALLPSTEEVRLGGERFVDIVAIATGGEGEVFRAYDRDLHRAVAIKCALRPDLVRFSEEVRTASRLEHPSIVPIHDIGFGDDGRPYFVMRYVEGDSLREIVRRLAAGDPAAHQTYCFEQRMQVFRKICEALAYAHARNVIHCDIKPANVLIGRFGEVFLTDWGIARRFDEPGCGVPEGTLAYMAPEQATGGQCDARTDVYGLCALLYEFLALRRYVELRGVEEAIAAIMTVRPPHPSDVSCAHQPRVPMDLGWFVLKGLQKDPERRWASVAEMLAQLDRRAQGRVPIQCTQTLIKRLLGETMRLFERIPLLVPLLALVFFAAIIAALLR